VRDAARREPLSYLLSPDIPVFEAPRPISITDSVYSEAATPQTPAFGPFIQTGQVSRRIGTGGRHQEKRGAKPSHAAESAGISRRPGGIGNGSLGIPSSPDGKCDATGGIPFAASETRPSIWPSRRIPGGPKCDEAGSSLRFQVSSAYFFRKPALVATGVAVGALQQNDYLIRSKYIYALRKDAEIAKTGLEKYFTWRLPIRQQLE
jgi:hypothetical protein